MKNNKLLSYEINSLYSEIIEKKISIFCF